MALFDRLFAKDKPDGALVVEVTDAVVDAVEPKVRMHSRYRQKLEPCVRKSIDHLRAIAREGLEPLSLTREAWATDPRVNTFFATAADVPASLARSAELRGYFDRTGEPQAYVLLGMKKEERAVLDQRDTRQTLVNFSDHRLIAPNATLAATRLEAGRRILLRLAQVSLARILAADAKATELESRKAYLAARLRLLRLSKDGMEGIVRDPATIDAEMKTLERELKETVEGYIEAKGSLATLDGHIGHIEAVFSRPDAHVCISHAPLRVSQLGVRVEGEATGPVNELSLAELAIGEFRAVIAIAQCPRAEMPSKNDLIKAAERSL